MNTVGCCAAPGPAAIGLAGSARADTSGDSAQTKQIRRLPPAQCTVTSVPPGGQITLPEPDRSLAEDMTTDMKHPCEGET
jgi:hypothetical protein